MKTVNGDAVRAEIQPPGYKLVDFPRSSRGGGGTALIYRYAYLKLTLVRRSHTSYRNEKL